jgi:hypothetical protein
MIKQKMISIEQNLILDDLKFITYKQNKIYNALHLKF